MSRLRRSLLTAGVLAIFVAIEILAAAPGSHRHPSDIGSLQSALPAPADVSVSRLASGHGPGSLPCPACAILRLSVLIISASVAVPAPAEPARLSEAPSSAPPARFPSAVGGRAPPCA